MKNKLFKTVRGKKGAITANSIGNVSQLTVEHY